MPAHTIRQLFTIPLLLLLVFGVACHKKVDPVLPRATFPPPTAAPAATEQAPQQTPALGEPPPTPPEESKKPVRRASRSTTPAAPAASPPTNQPLHLGEMLTPEQERQYNTALDRSLQSAQANIAVVSKRRLSKEQQVVVAQVQSFIEQAQSARKTNLTAAKSLAARADVLARELARTIR
jgi:hypothetical protein